MLRNRGSVVFIGVLASLLIPWSPMPAYSAPITERDAKLIEIAYINGFVAAFQLDEKTIADLKKNRKLLRQLVITKSKEYLNIVKGLNKE